LYSALVVCEPSSAKNVFGSTAPTPDPPKPPGPSTISSQVHYTRSYTGSGAKMASSSAAWSPPVCWYEPTYTAKQMYKYLHDNYEAEQNAQEALGQDDEPGINYHTGEKGSWWKLTFPGDVGSSDCTAPHSWLWVTPTTPSTAKVPIIDPKTLAGLAYNDTTLPAPPITLRPAAQNQLVNLDTELAFSLPLNRVWTTAELNNPALGVDVAATTVAVPTQLRVDAGTDYADPRTCTYDLTAHDGTYGVSTKDDPCNVTYNKASPAGGYQLSASIVWKVTWTASADPDGPPQAEPALPDGESQTRIAVTVRENEAVNR
jgi:enoyl reductase